MTYEYSYGPTLLQVKNVSLDLGSKPILRNVNVEIKDILRPGLTQGQVVALLGPSGMGKTQLFRILAGLNRPTSGEVFVTKDAIPVEAGMVGVVAQTYPLFDHYSVLENLKVAGNMAGLNNTDARDKSLQLLEKFGLSDRASAWPGELSGGQRQRVAIAQQLMCSDHFLLMDEPFSGLDPVKKDTCCQLIRDVAAMNELTTIIVVTHDIASSVEIADTLWLLGRERDTQGQPIPGASVQANFNLIDRGLTWHPDLTKLPAFAECVREVRTRFDTL